MFCLRGGDGGEADASQARLRKTNCEFQHSSLPERLRAIQHPSLSILPLFTSGSSSLHANSITGIKIVCPVHPQKLCFPSPCPLPHPHPLTPHTTYRLSAPWVSGLGERGESAGGGRWEGIRGAKPHREAAALKNVPARCVCRGISER